MSRRPAFLFIPLVSLLILESPRPGWSCTTAVVSGKATADGRPLLWKNRDTRAIRNEVTYFPEGKYATLAVVDAGERGSIWMGVNAAGLCIENSVTKDLAHPDEVKGLGNGGFMLRVLQTCATVAEVKQLLEQTDETGRSTNANFGVIDAVGGAALFEASHNAHVMYDANDPSVAPHGIVIRSNFSLTGQGFAGLPTAEELGTSYSAERYLRATELLTEQAEGPIDARYILRHCARDMASANCEPFPGTINGPAGELPQFISTACTISRTTTVSFAVFQGVRPGEDPRLTTMWLGLGDPKFSIAIPCWVAMGQVAEELRGEKGGPLCLAAIELRERFYSKDDDGVHTAGLQEIWQEFWTFEDSLLSRVDAKLAEWRNQGIDPHSMTAIHLSSAEQALAAVKHQLANLPPLTTPAASAD